MRNTPYGDFSIKYYLSAKIHPMRSNIASVLWTAIALSLCNPAHAQQRPYVVTALRDTVYVDKISLTDEKVKTRTGGVKKTYDVAEITAFYDSGEHKNYERIPNPEFGKTKAPESDRYDYRQQERSHIDAYNSRIRYKFVHRLTDGKVKLFKEGKAYYTMDPQGVAAPGYDNTTYYIAIPDARPERIDHEGELELTASVYTVLRMYLHGNNDIRQRLDQLYASRPKATQAQIVALIGDYNEWFRMVK